MANPEHVKILEDGEYVWDKWRKSNRLIKPDLRKVDLFRANLQEVNLLRADLREANLQEVNLLRADLRGANLNGAYLLGADLRGANLKGAFFDYTFVNSKTRGLERLSKAQRARCINVDEIESDDKDLAESIAKTRENINPSRNKIDLRVVEELRIKTSSESNVLKKSIRTETIKEEVSTSLEKLTALKEELVRFKGIDEEIPQGSNCEQLPLDREDIDRLIDMVSTAIHIQNHKRIHPADIDYLIYVRALLQHASEVLQQNADKLEEGLGRYKNIIQTVGASAAVIAAVITAIK